MRSLEQPSVRVEPKVDVEPVQRVVGPSLVAILAKLGIKDERIFDAICDVFDEDLVFGSCTSRTTATTARSP